MNKDTNRNISVLDVESRDWLKLEQNMKTFGFQEGAAKGRETTLQKGFNKGFSTGFKMGMELGIARGILSCALKSGFQRHFNFDEQQLDKFFNKSCILCQNENNKEIFENKFYKKSLKSLISEQEEYNDNILKSINTLFSNSDI